VGKDRCRRIGLEEGKLRRDDAWKILTASANQVAARNLDEGEDGNGFLSLVLAIMKLHGVDQEEDRSSEAVL
jgi:hypothetical protein